MAVDTPTGMSASEDATHLVFHRGHPHPDEMNDPVSYGQRPPQSLDPIAHYEWREARSEANAENGSPIIPDIPPETPLGLDQ